MTLVTAPTPSLQNVLLVILHLLSWSFLYLPFQHLLCIKCLRSVCSLQVVCSCLSDSSSEPPPPPHVFFLHQPNFSLHICEGANDSLTGMLSDRRCLSSGGASAFSWELVCVCWSMCVWKKKRGGIVRTWPAHFACSPRDRCSWASTGAWQLPFIAVFSTLNPWPALPPSSSSSSSSPPLSSHPLSSTSDLFSRRFPRPSWVMDCERLVGGLRFLYVVVWCGRLVTILTLSGHGNPAVQNEQRTHTHTRPHTHLHNFLFNSP